MTSKEQLELDVAAIVAAEDSQQVAEIVATIVARPIHLDMAAAVAIVTALAEADYMATQLDLDADESTRDDPDDEGADDDN